MATPKRKKIALTVSIKEIQRGVPYTLISEKYGIWLSTVADIKKMKQSCVPISTRWWSKEGNDVLIIIKVISLIRTNSLTWHFGSRKCTEVFG